jgi:diacylglycerol kinase (ATP)
MLEVYNILHDSLQGMFMTTELPDYRPTRAKLIFNPIAGVPTESPSQLVQIITEMQALHFVPEVFVVQPECDLGAVVQDALERGIRLFVVSGGDGTIESVAQLLVGTRAALGVIPTGTANNVALSLAIPASITAAVSLLRKGRREKVDAGLISCCGVTRPFLEVCSVGLFSALFPAVDDIQRGQWGRIGDFLATLVTSPLAEMHLTLDNQQTIHTQGHVILVTNMPYVGSNYPIAGERAHRDGWLDVLVFADLSKLQVLSTVVQMVSAGWEDPRIQRYRVKQIQIFTEPDLPVLADGVIVGEGSLTITIQRRALTVISNRAKPGLIEAGG